MLGEAEGETVTLGEVVSAGVGDASFVSEPHAANMPISNKADNAILSFFM